MAPETDNNADVAQQGDEDLDALFEEAASAREDSPTDKVVDALEADPDEEQEGAMSPPGEAPGVQEAVADPNASPADKASDEVDWSQAPPAFKAAYEADKARQEHAVKSLKGRLSALDRRLEEYRKAAPQHSDASGDQSSDDDDEHKLIGEFREDYAEIAKPIELMLKRAGIDLDKAQPKPAESSFSPDQIEAAQAEAAILETMHPDWNTLDMNAYNDWIEAQPDHIKRMAANNSELIVDAQEIGDVISRFKASQTAQAHPSQQPNARRQAQLSGAKSVRTTQPAVAQGDPDDFDAIFANAARKTDQKFGRSTRQI